MKNFYNDKKQTTGSRIWLAVLTVVASLAFSINAYGEADFWLEKACNLNIWSSDKEGGDVWLGGKDGYNKDTGDECVYEYGTVTNMYLKQWWTKLYKNGGDNICKDTLFYKLSGSTTTHKYGGWKISDLESSDESWGCNGDMSINVISSLCKNVPGNYTIEYWFKAVVGSDCSDAAKRGDTYCNNGARNYKVSFTYPGIVLTTKSVKIEGTSENETVYFTQYGQDATYSTSLSGGLSSHFKVTDPQAGSLIVTYTGSSNTIETETLTITPSAGAGEPVEVILEGSTGNAPLPLIGEEVVKNGNTATLSGYLKYTGCAKITDFGFYYCTGADCTPTTSSDSVHANGCDLTVVTPKELARGELFSKTLIGLTYNPATWYGYRSYAVYYNGKENVTVLSDETGRFYVDSQCDLPEGDTLYVDIDKKYAGNESLCDLQYASIENAIDGIMHLSDAYADNALKRHVVFEIDGSTYTTETQIGDVTGGGKTGAYCHQFHNINNVANPTKWLILRAKDSVNKPTILHPSIRNSKLIRFENVRLVGDATTKDNAIDLENGYGDADGGWFKQPLGAVANANIQFINCYIKSWGFTCLHASAYDLITFEECDFEAELTDVDDNVIAWGASAKFIHCSNIKFLRNNFRGSHATSVWLQGCQKTLFMNNVFWNNNLITTNVAFARLVSQDFSDGECFDPKLQEIAFYYNTMYLAACPSTVSPAYRVDFFRLGSTYSSVSSALGHMDKDNDIDINKIAFQFNNCYSYEKTDVIGKTADVFLNLTADDFCERIRNNNFWSAYDENQDPRPTESAFNIGCYNNFINVPSQVCTTGAEDPAGLVVKGIDLNTGMRVGVDVSGLGAENMLNDRLHAEANRPANGLKWTVGAYQQSTSSDPLTEIVWFGGADTWRAGKSTAEAQVAWDNRNNWYKMDGTRVTCVDNLAADVKVIIPEANSKVYPHPEGGILYYPTLPAFTSDDRQTDTERVDAGLGVLDEKEAPTKFFETLELEEGAAIKGVENLYSNETRHYTEAKNSFTAGRSEWILVGTVIKPFTDGSKSATRNIQSADYYLNHLPHVYMHKAKIEDASVSWDNPFTSLEEEVAYNTAFAIRIPDEYGPYKLPAKWYYYGKPEAETAGTAKHTYSFNGWFLNDAVDPVYPVSGNTLLCNTYPANINVETAQSVNKGTIKYYNYSEQTFVGLGAGNDEIKSQAGFLFMPTKGENDGYFRITNEMLKNTSTKYKSSDVEKTRYYIKSYNDNGEDGSSIAGIILDKLKSDVYTPSLDVLNTEETTLTNKPEVYVMMYDKSLDNYVTPDFEKTIPLGLIARVNMTAVFATFKSDNVESAILEDRQTGETYDLLEGDASIKLSKGTYEGRFYLNLTEVEEPLPTDVDDETSSTAAIDILGDGKSIVISSSENVVLKSAEITDMAGRTTYVDLKNPHYNKVNVKGAQGVYIVRVIGDVMSETSKVLVK